MTKVCQTLYQMKKLPHKPNLRIIPNIASRKSCGCICKIRFLKIRFLKKYVTPNRQKISKLYLPVVSLTC